MWIVSSLSCVVKYKEGDPLGPPVEEEEVGGEERRGSEREVGNQMNGEVKNNDTFYDEYV